ncbi:hypothetical protein CCUS01_05732 [Colletotrichum cuscutae]|uniref:Uncharacterized protein n=1 Tax=Colletotrichum cuscutae TaxID=1209917 RepID=A0AAI9Y4K5_9PEZI|nr:hypothetical protein CCUS01_05732 [Colletotrichum cuscutae]
MHRIEQVRVGRKRSSGNGERGPGLGGISSQVCRRSSMVWVRDSSDSEQVPSGPRRFVLRSYVADRQPTSQRLKTQGSAVLPAYVSHRSCSGAAWSCCVLRIGDGYGGTSEDLPARAWCLVCFGVSGVRNPDSRPDSKASTHKSTTPSPFT